MEKRLQEAQVYKEEGNQRYREGKYRDAVSRYHRALLQLRGLDPSLPSPLSSLGPQGPALTPEQENILHTIQTHCYNNLAGKYGTSVGRESRPQGRAVVEHDFNPTTQEVEAVQIQSEFQDSQGYTEKPCIKKQNKQKR
jgi:hypothetical protein